MLKPGPLGVGVSDMVRSREVRGGIPVWAPDAALLAAFTERLMAEWETKAVL